MTLNGKVVSELSDCEFPFPRRARPRTVIVHGRKRKKKANGLTDCASRCALLPAQGMKPQIIYSANECSTAGCGTLPDFSWDNVTITLSEAKKDLGTLISYHGASSDGLKTTDGGVTWHADSISMGKDTDWSTQ